MKQKILMLLLAAVTFTISVTAQKADSITINAGDFKNISIAEDMDVVLLTGTAATSDFSVSKEAAGNLEVTFSGEKLKLEQKRRSTKATVYLTVCHLQQLTLGENTVVHVNGLVTSPELRLFIDTNAKVYIRTTGTIKAHATGDTAVNVEPVAANASTGKVILF